MSVSNFSKVVLDLTKNPDSTIEDITNRTKLKKETVNRILSGLIKDNLINSVNNKFSLSKLFLNLKSNYNSDVYFNFKIKLEDKEKIYYLFNIIKNYLLNTIQIAPNKTQMQKLVIQINNKLNLNLPIIWYKYGEIVPICYNPNKDYGMVIKENKFNISEKEIYNIINLNIIKSSKIKSAKELKSIQYNSKDDEIHKLYQLKEKLLEHIYKDDFYYIKNNIEKLIKLIPYFKDTYNIKGEFLDFITYFTKVYSKDDYKLKNLFVKLFNVFWDYIALHNYIYFIKQYYIKNEYNLEDLSVNTCFKLNMYKEEFYEILDQFYEDFNINDFVDNPELRKLLDKTLS